MSTLTHSAPILTPGRCSRLCQVPLLAALLAAWLPLSGCRSTAPTSAAAPSAPAASAPSSPAPLTDEQRALYVASFDMVWQTVKDQHWDPALTGATWDAARDELRPKVESAATADEARAATTELLHRLGQSHFAIIPASTYRDVRGKPAASPSAADPHRPDSPAAAAPADSASPDSETDDADDRPRDGYTGLTVRVAGGVAIVTRVREGSPAQTVGIKPGWIVSAIDGRAVAPSLERITATMSGSTLLEATLAMSVERRMNGPVGGTVRIEFLDASDHAQVRTITLGPPPGFESRFGNLPTMHVTVDTARLDGNIGYIAFSAFLDPARVMPEINKAIESFSDARGIIIDLRGNPGGIGVMANGIGGWFVTEPNQKLGTMTTRQATLNFVLNPRARPFTGPLAILVDGLSLSTSEIFAGGLQDLRRARVFGTRTGGAALPSQIIRLPSGDGFQFAMANYTSVGGQVLEGRGVIPDQEVHPDRAALLAGRDPVLDAAVAWIESQPGAPPPPR